MSNDQNDNLDSVKMFEFVRIRPNKTKKNKLLKTSQTDKEESEQTNESDLIQGRVVGGVPKRRSGHRAVCNDKYLYIWGGYSPSQAEGSDNEDENDNPNESPLYPELWRFKFSTRKWCLLKTSGEAPNETVASHCALLCGNTLIAFGGTGFPFGSKLSNTLYTCNLMTLEWKKHDLTGVKPLKLYGSSAIVVENTLYILFGTTSRAYVCNIYKINLKTLESEKLFDSTELIHQASFRELEALNQEYPNDFLKGLYRQEVVHYKNKFYVFGGGNSEGMAYPFDTIPVFDLDTCKWQFIATQADQITNEFPERRKFHSCILVDNYVYVFGGMYSDLETFKPVENCLWRLNLNEIKWEKMNIKMPVLTYFHAACSNSNGQIYLHGGVKACEDYSIQSRINHLYSFLVKVPKLSEICWNKLIANNPNLLNYDQKKLVDIGLPTCFINRII